jgi:putative ABC transport system permease protein
MACTLLIFLWVNHEMSYDKFHTNYDQIYRIVENQYYAGNEVFPVAVTPSPLGSNLKENYSEVINYTRFKNRTWVVEKDEKAFSENMGLVDSGFFEIFSVKFIEGNPNIAFSNSLSVILTKDVADKYFDGESPLGKTLKINKNYDFTVSAVIEKLPENSHINFDILLPFEHLKNERDLDQWGNNWIYTYVLTVENLNLEEFNNKIKNIIKDNSEGSVTEIYLQPLNKIHLYAAGKYTADIGGLGDIKIVKIFIVIGIFVLLIACINYMNLSTAKSVNRAREISIKKVVGSTKSQIIFQFLSESIFVSFVAFIIAIVLASSFLPLFNELSGKSLVIPYHLKSFIGISLVFVLVIGLISGSYPSFILSSFKPAAILKGSNLGGGKGNSSFRRVLVVLQFTLSIFLIIGFLIISQQLNYIQNKKLGLDKDNVVYFYQSQNMMQKSDVVKNTLTQNPDILSLTTANQLPTNISNSTSGVTWEGKNPDETMLFHMLSVDHGYQDVFKMELTEGRFFPSDSLAVVVNEKTIEVMGLEDPIGKAISFYGFDVRIIGVLKDFHFKSLHTKIEPIILFQRQEMNYIMYARINNKNITQTIKFIESTYNEYLTDNRDFFYKFLDENYEALYNAEKRTSKIFSYFAILAIFISCLGLYGLASFMVEKRIKEIGIRKVNGASLQNIIGLLTKDFTKWVLLSFIIASPFAWYIMDNWLQNFEYRIDIAWWIFVLAGSIALIIAWLTVSFQSIKAALKNPVDALRDE